MTEADAAPSAEAIAALRRAVAVNPRSWEAWRALGDQLTRVGDLVGAGEAFAHYVRLPNADPVLAAASAAMRVNRLADAERALRDHLRRMPNDVAALWMLGDIGVRVAHYDQSRALLERCLSLAPDFAAARLTYAHMFTRQRRPAEALEQLEHLLASDPDSLVYLKLKALALQDLGEFERAIEAFEGVLARESASPDFWVSYGDALKTAGRLGVAVEAYNRAAAMAPNSGRAYWSLANLKEVRLSTANEASMRQALSRPGLSVDDRLLMMNALGKVLEDREDFAGSFEHYAASARLRRGQIRYDPAANHARVRRSIALFTAEFFARRAGGGRQSDAPIFVVGLPRSGSTLVEQILASHSRVEPTLELMDIMNLADELTRAAPGGAEAYPALLADLGDVQRQELGESYLTSASRYRRLGRSFFIDKMPNNFQHLGLIQLILPNARIIDVRRHPMAVGFAVFKQHFAGGQLFSYDLGEIGRYYADYLDLMAHFDEVIPGRVHRVIYEDLVENTETEVRKLLAYCRLDFEPACLDFHRNARAVRTASSEQVRRPIFRDGLDQWRRYEPWLGPLRQALGTALDRWR